MYRAPGNLAIRDSAPDGRLLLTVGRSKPSLIGLAPGETKERDLSWLDFGVATDLSADGKTFLFSEQGDGGGPEYAVYIRGTNGSAPTLLGRGAADALSPDGRWALVLNLTPPTHLVLLPTGAGEARALPRGTLVQFHGGTFFPDGKRIALVANEEDKGPRLWLQELAGGDPKAISPEGVGFAFSGTVSPDGALVAGRSDAGLALYPASGGEPRPIRGTELSDEPLRFSGDGRFLYVRGFAPGQGIRLPARVFRVDLTKGTRELWKELSPPGVSSLGVVTALVIAPDVGAYAYTYFEPVSTLYEVRGIQ